MGLQKDGISISSTKISRDIEAFKYLINFSLINLDKMNPTELLDAIKEYKRIIVKRFYNWEEDYLVKSFHYYNSLSSTKSGSKEIKKSLVALQNALNRSIYNFKWRIENKSNKMNPLRASFCLIYRIATDDFEPQFLMSNQQMYVDLIRKGDVCITSAISEIFSFVIMSILTAFSIKRFGVCKNCGKMFFSETEKVRLFCKHQCGNTHWQRNNRQKNNTTNI